MEAISIPGAEIYYDKSFLSEKQPSCLMFSRRKCAWERRKTSFKSAVPRDEAYYGDPGTNYTYSRREYTPFPWIPELLALKARVDDATPASAYANLHLPKLAYSGCFRGTIAARKSAHYGGQTQKNFKHEVPKEPEAVQSRINLTFRRIEHR
jgi:hypothetical protein